MPGEGLAEEKVQGVVSTVVGRCQACPHSFPQIHPAPGIAAQWLEQADGTSVMSAVRRGGQRQLTPSDSLPMPRSGWP